MTVFGSHNTSPTFVHKNNARGDAHHERTAGARSRHSKGPNGQGQPTGRAARSTTGCRPATAAQVAALVEAGAGARKVGLIVFLSPVFNCFSLFRLFKDSIDTSNFKSTTVESVERRLKEAEYEIERERSAAKRLEVIHAYEFHIGSYTYNLDFRRMNFWHGFNDWKWNNQTFCNN